MLFVALGRAEQSFGCRKEETPRGSGSTELSSSSLLLPTLIPWAPLAVLPRLGSFWWNLVDRELQKEGKTWPGHPQAQGRVVGGSGHGQGVDS